MGRLVDENTLTQKEIVLKHLKKYRVSGISDNDARDLYGIRRLSGRIHDLRLDGYKIETEWHHTKNRYGKKTRYGTYRLVK